MSDPAHDYQIIRHRRDEYATYGRLYDGRAQLICVTLGPPWICDESGCRIADISDFQHGFYSAFLRKSHLHGGDGHRDYDVWQYENVPDVEAAQLHIGNFPWDSRACTLLGVGFGDVVYGGPTIVDGRYPREHGKSYRGITASGLAYAKFMKDSLALCAREQRERIWIRVSDRFDAPTGTWA